MQIHWAKRDNTFLFVLSFPFWAAQKSEWFIPRFVMAIL